MHSMQIPEIRLTKRSVATFIPVPIASLLFIFLKQEIVIGRHQARGIIIQHCATHPMIKKTFVTVMRVSFSPDDIS